MNYNIISSKNGIQLGLSIYFKYRSYNVLIPDFW